MYYTSLIGMIIGDKMMNYTGMKNFANQIWKYPRRLQVSEIRANCFQFVFGDAEEMDHVLMGGPWIIDKQILVLKKWEEGIEENPAAFNKAYQCVQVWNLPLHWLSKSVGRNIGSVCMNVKDVLISQAGGKEGKIGHDLKKCNQGVNLGEEKGDLQFGEWMRVNSSRSSPKKNDRMGQDGGESKNAGGREVADWSGTGDKNEGEKVKEKGGSPGKNERSMVGEVGKGVVEKVGTSSPLMISLKSNGKHVIEGSASKENRSDRERSERGEVQGEVTDGMKVNQIHEGDKGNDLMTLVARINDECPDSQQNYSTEGSGMDKGWGGPMEVDLSGGEQLQKREKMRRYKKLKGNEYRKVERTPLAELTNAGDLGKRKLCVEEDQSGMLLENIQQEKKSRTTANELRSFVETVNRACKEWSEWEESNAQTEKRNNNQTSDINCEAVEEFWNKEAVHIVTAVDVQVNSGCTSVGIAALNGEAVTIKAWAYKESRIRILEVEEAEAVKIAMIKAAQEGWTKIVIHANSRRLLKKFNQGDCSDLLLSTSLGDILNLKEMFATCSLCLSSKQIV
ncbi:hypothetical protein ACH5RR_041825 [Cinchona calisaya]|uniref:DUF4283 domain-containing protein n=1 Tax=Cinchona calisaya TaxID=153742 RepID=A0ABD2XV87_9GENT